MRFLTILFAILFSIPVYSQENQNLISEKLKEVELELAKQKLIRIVEPAIINLQVLGKKSSYMIQYDVFKNCGHSVQTELGYAFVRCDATPPSIRYFEGGPFEDYYGDRLIVVTVEGYETLEQLEEKNKPIVIGKLTVTTKVLRYTKKDEIERDRYIKENSNSLAPSLRAAEPIKAGDPKSWEITASKVIYEFPKLGK